MTTFWKFAVAAAILAAVAAWRIAVNYRRHRKGKNPVAETVEDVLDGDPRDMKAVAAERAAWADRIAERAKGWRRSVESAARRVRERGGK